MTVYGFQEHNRRMRDYDDQQREDDKRRAEEAKKAKEETVTSTDIYVHDTWDGGS